MKEFFNKRSKKVIDQAIRTLTKLQKPFAIISLFLILSGAFFAPIVHAYNVWNDPVQTVEIGENNETSPMELYDQVDSSMIPIEKEIERFRDENHKVFLKKDGSYEVSIYNDPVHYKEEDQFIEIDNTLVDLGKYYTNQQNNFNIYFPKALNKNESIKIKQDDYQIEWKLNDTKDSKAKKGDKVKKSDDQTILDHLNSSLKYQDAFTDTDLEYVLKSNKVKENIYLKKYHEDVSYTFEYKLKNLSLELIKGVYYFVNQAGDALYSLDELYMIDEQGIISYDVRIEVEQKANNKYFVKIIPDDTFLKEASYPVLIDPTITLSRQSPVISDTFVVENYPYENYHNMPTMEVGYVGSSGGRRDILMKFEIPSFITSNEVITYSHLNLTRTDDTYSDLQINVHKNVNNFTPSNVTWETKPNYYNEVIDYYSYKYVYAPIHFDISKTVKEWHENGNNYGFTISPEKYVASVKRIYQSQASYEVRPVVKIGYESKGGLKNYWTYSSQELGGAGTGYISDFTGNLVFVRNEYHLDNEYLPLTLSFYHNTLSRNINIGYGRGQKTNYNYKILLDNNVNQYYLETPDGNKVYFHNTYSDQSEYPYQWDYSLAEDGSRWELFQEFYQGSLTYATITTPERIKYEFDHLGRLSQVIDQNTYHSIRINYLSGDMISGITDSAGNRIQFTYSSNQLFLTELQLKQPDGSFRTVEKRSYSYQGGNVSAVNLSINYNKNTNNLSYVSTFYYGYEENRLVSAYSSLDDYKVLYTYNASNKVTHMSLTDNNYNLSDISIKYDYLKTTYTNHKNEWVSYLFDNYGHTINILDSNLNASYFRYANPYSYINIHSNLNGYDLIDQKPNYLINHKLIEASDALKQTHNYLSNHGFENISGLSPWALNNQTGRVDVDNEIRLLGDKSLRVYSQTGVNQSIMLKAGFYRLSVWVKNKDVSGGGRVRVQINSETTSKATSKMGEWEELTLDFNLSKETTITIYLENTKTDKVSYFDNISLTEGFIDTRYNALENHSFENGLNNWETRGASTTLNTETGEMAKIFGKNHLKIQGNTNESRYASQVITNFLTEGETYMIGAWAKANASPNTAINGINRGRFFSLEVHITKENDDDSIGTVSYYLPFNANTNDWQHQMIAIEIPYKTFEVTVVLKYQGTGVALFDNVQLYHDNLKTDYRYDGSNGNLLEKKSASGTTSYTYDSSYRVTSITENNQRLDISHAYNGIYQLSMNNVKANYTYNAKNQISETILGDQSKAWFKSSIGYTNDFQYINSTTDASGNQTNYQVNHLTSLIDMIENANLDKTYFSYDNYGNLIRQEEIETITGSSIIKDMGYDSSHRLETITIDGITYQFSYDPLDRVTNIKIAGIDYVTLNYLSENHNNKSYQTHKVSTQTYANNDSYGFIYDDEDNLVKISLNGTDLYSYSYDQKNRLTMYQDLRQNNIYFYSYDLAGRIEEIIDQNENRISYTYDGLGNLNSSDYTYQGINRKVYYIYNQYTGEYDYTYYEVGDKEVRKIYNTDPEDSLRRISEINLVIGNSLNISQAFSYLNPNNANGNTSLLVEKINYKKNGVIETTHAFKYDKLLNITEITLTGKTNESYNYTYDGFNRLIREDITLDNYQRTITYSYDMRGNILSIKTYYKNKITETPLKETIYRYNQGAWKDQIRSILYLVNGIEIKEEVYTYDQIGNVISITKNQISNSMKAMEDVVSTSNMVDASAGATNDYYDPEQWRYNNETGYYDYIGPIQWVYEDEQKRFSIDLPGRNIITEFQIDEYLKGWTGWLSWGYNDSITFDLNGVWGYQELEMYQLYSFRVSANSAWLKVRYKDLNTAPKITGEQKILNNIDNPYTVSEIIALANLKVYDDFQGDLSHALIVISDSYTQNKQKVGTYELIFRAENNVGLYDKFRLEVENIKLTNPKIIGPNQSSQSLGQGFNETSFLNQFRATNNFNEHLNISLIESNHVPNQAGEFELILKASDDYGNETYFIHHLEVYINQPTEEPMTQSFTWEGRRLIKHIIDGRVHQYTYNDQGIRTSKKVDGILTEYFLEGNKVLVEKTRKNVIYYTYDVEGEILSMNYLGEEYFYIKNMQGDILELINSNGHAVAKYSYDAWGNIIYQYDDGSNISNINPYRYRGYRYDDETGHYYLNTRYYDPSIARFISADSINYLDPSSSAGLNLYAYCNNNPVMYSDPSGNFPILATILIISAITGLGLTIAGVATDNNTMTAIGLTMIAIPALVSGGLALFGSTGALAHLIGGTTMVAGAGTGAFASAEWQQTFTGNNWMLDAGMSEEWYNGLMITTATIATFGTAASSFAYSFNINSIQKIGKVGDHYGMRFTQKAPSGNLRYKSIEFHSPHNGHGYHWQQNTFNGITGRRTRSAVRWTWWLKKL